MRRFILIGIFVVILTFLVNAVLTTTNLMPAPASAQAVPIDKLFGVHFFLISFLFSLIFVFMVYSIIVFRRKKGDMGAGAPIKGNSKLEIVWTVIPLGLVLYLSFIGSQSLSDVRRVDPQALNVKVTAGQWYYQFEYPDYGIKTSALYLPVNQQVLLRMTSVDVIHNFWVPEFRVKQDILPGSNLVKELRITPDKIGDYKILCAQLCGEGHSGMVAPLKVMSKADFLVWVDQQKSATSQDPVARGQIAAAQCKGCHTIDGSKGVGPTWKGLSGSDVLMEDGQTVKADDVFLKNMIMNPNSYVIKGFKAGIMPQNYGKTLTDQQIQDIIAYIKSLK
jgi:cytochrome c oxidase subunit 2